MQQFTLTLAGQTYHVTIENPAVNPIQVTVDGDTFPVYWESAAAPAAPPTAAPALDSAPGGPSPQSTKAPMPGVINKIAVKPGDQVQRGQELCVLEAMKMNNVIRATAPGQVKQVHVTLKQSVQHGDLLITWESQ
jgi:biotin carboxyl carrier protein